MALACGPGCKRHRARPAALRASRTVYDTSPLDASAFGTDAATRQRVLGMPAGELAARLRAFKLVAHSRFSITAGLESMQQDDSYLLTQDAAGSFILNLDTPHSQLEVHQIGEVVYVRYDRGSMRKKTRRDMDSEALRDVAVATLPQALSLCHGLVFKNPQPDQLDGHLTTRYTLALGGSESAPPRDVAPALALHLPMAPPPLWREHSRVTKVQGFVSVDTATGVLLRGQIEAHLQILDRGAAPTDMQVHADLQITQVGRVPMLPPPGRALGEFKRPIRVTDPLAFFRDVLPRQTTAPNADSTP